MFKDLTDKKFNRLKVIDISHEDNNRLYHWNCVCECGNEIIVKGSHLRSGHTKSCGCLRKEIQSERLKKSNYRHGLRFTNEYNIWSTMKARCSNINHNRYKNYGGRGIKVCDKWLNDFINFYKDMGKRPSKEYSIDRIDNDGNYEPNNCRWATWKQQANNRSNNLILK